MSTAVQYSKHIEIPAPTPEKSASTLPEALIFWNRWGPEAQGGRERRGQGFLLQRPTHCSAEDKNTVTIPNTQQRHTFRTGRYLASRTKMGQCGNKESGGHGLGAQCPRRSGWSRRAPLPPQQRECCCGSGMGLVCLTHEGCTQVTETTVPGMEKIHAKFLSPCFLFFTSDKHNKYDGFLMESGDWPWIAGLCKGALPRAK